MSPSAPFVDRGTNTLDTGQIIAEAVPLATLIGLFVAIALVPLLFVFFFGGHSIAGALFTVVAQFVLAVGSGIVLMYSICRGIQLAEES